MDIRFESMTNEEFTECTNESILTNIEELQVFKFIGSGGNSECKFSSEKRSQFITKLSILDTVKLRTKMRLINCDSLRFKINKSLKIGGFGIQITDTFRLNFPEKVEIKLANRYCTEVLKNDTEIVFTEASKIHDLLFNDTFTLEADTEYVLEYKFSELLDDKYGFVPQIYEKKLFDDNLSFKNTNNDKYCSIVYIGIVK